MLTRTLTLFFAWEEFVRGAGRCRGGLFPFTGFARSGVRPPRMSSRSDSAEGRQRVRNEPLSADPAPQAGGMGGMLSGGVALPTPSGDDGGVNRLRFVPPLFTAQGGD